MSKTDPRNHFAWALYAVVVAARKAIREPDDPYVAEELRVALAKVEAMERKWPVLDLLSHTEDHQDAS